MKLNLFIVTGGVVSSWQGVVAASLDGCCRVLGLLSLSILKLDPYINVDPGTMSHASSMGRCSSRKMGAETDLELLRAFTDTSSSAQQCHHRLRFTAVINKLTATIGGTVQVIPTSRMKLKNASSGLQKNTNPDVVITEIGGTVGILNRCRFWSPVHRCGNQECAVYA